ncbi:MAG: HPr family phosphocarrier protein [Magnetococcus sp. WYHC-3]
MATPPDETCAERRVTVGLRLGLHVRTSARFAALCEQFACQVRVFKDNIEVDGRSVMGLMTLAASQGQELLLRVRGPRAQETLEALCALLEDPSSGTMVS